MLSVLIWVGQQMFQITLFRPLMCSLFNLTPSNISVFQTKSNIPSNTKQRNLRATRPQWSFFIIKYKTKTHLWNKIDRQPCKNNCIEFKYISVFHVHWSQCPSPVTKNSSSYLYKTRIGAYPYNTQSYSLSIFFSSSIFIIIISYS